MHQITNLVRQPGNAAPLRSVNMYIEKAKNDYGPRKSLTSAPENYYSTIARSARGNEIVNIATLAMNGNMYANPDQVMPGQRDKLEPMYIDVIERSRPRKKSRKIKCLVAWLVILTLTSLASLAFTTIIFYRASTGAEKGKIGGKFNSPNNGKASRNVVKRETFRSTINHFFNVILWCRP